MNTGKLTHSLLLAIFFFSTSHLAAQIELKLQFMGDHIYSVFARFDDTVSPIPPTITASGQITLVIPEDSPWFFWESVNGLWENSGIESNPVQNPTKRYAQFELTNAEPGDPLVFSETEETLLFSIYVIGNCPESIYLLDCGTPNESDPFCGLSTSSEGLLPNDLSVVGFEQANVSFYQFSNIYAPYAWDCHDNDGDGIPNAMEDTNGNGIFDDGDASDLNDPNVQAPDHQLSEQDAHLPDLEMGFTGQNDPSKAYHAIQNQQLSTAHHQQNFTLSPNPASNVLLVHFGEEKLLAEATLYLMNSQGVVLQKIKTDAAASQQIDISALPAGLYMIAIEDGSGFNKNKKFIKN